ncbi:molecular chaperone [Serratia microhaemolytica]|uniref:fimbrial biogenesis chaperone n=1 Tax=Serratia microhaemolytica TaxID=2675110 RepID=UPI000FDDED4F|nr:molecular chaperone [Serratia microhaemolytica]
MTDYVRLHRWLLTSLLLVGVIFQTNQLQAAGGGLQLQQTRVIFNAKDQNAKATINNQSDRVYLIKSSVLASPNPADAQNRAAQPFMITPPLFRMEPQSQSSVLVVRNGTSALPTDRESVFYLSLLAIPSSPKMNEDQGNDVAAQVSVGIQSIIKLFYRPAGLKEPVQTAARRLTFQHSGGQLRVHNPTPYFVTLARVKLDGKAIDVREIGAMVSPFSTQHYPLKNALITGQAQKVTWTVITDFGGESSEYHATLSQ